MWVMDRPSGERIKVRGDNYIVDCSLSIVDLKNKNNQQTATSKQQMKRARARIEQESEK